MEEDRLDTLAEILEVATGVIEDYGPGDGRIQRLAFWIAENLGGEFPSPVWMNQLVTNEPGELSKTGPGRRLTSNEARRFAALLLRAADKAEE